MKRDELEQIANLIEQMINLSKLIIHTRENWISYYPVVQGNDGYNLAVIATSLANKVLQKGYCSDKALQRAIRGRAYAPSETVMVERPRFNLKALYYHQQKQTHLIVLGKP